MFRASARVSRITMGNCLSGGGGESSEQKRKSQAIDKQLEEDSKRLRKEVKILLLGEFGRGAIAVVL
jgi:guanine nucleotide-binding protein G(i) subunit alpha